MLQGLLEKCNSGEEIHMEWKKVNHVCRKTITNRDLILNVNIGDFNMGDTISYLGSEVNVFPKKT